MQFLSLQHCAGKMTVVKNSNVTRKGSLNFENLLNTIYTVGIATFVN